ncbi:conserved hypothetical protein [Ricinus communis]|uniref:Uncharacterized protein n=1 Tax=Ricinus communis TaxID=3988 RepID=B9T744_RICCO|nr:conserved hypothetical protein [Ricinus communis]
MRLCKRGWKLVEQTDQRGTRIDLMVLSMSICPCVRVLFIEGKMEMTIMKPMAAGGGATLGRIFNVLGELIDNLV